MNNTEPIRLNIPNNMEYLPPVLAFLRELAANIGFNKEEINKIELASEEAVTNVILHSLPRNEKTSFELEVQPLTIGVEISIHDMGRPFDEKIIAQYDPEKLSAEKEIRGLGSFLIKNAMDVVEYHTLGNKGKMLRMVKYFETPHTGDELTKIIPWEIPDEPAHAMTDQDFTIRRFRPEDAASLAELAYDTYGYSYLYENVYFPDRTVALNETNEIISVVVVTEDGTLAGHAGMFCNPANPGIAELAMAMVKPEYRGYHLLDRISQTLYSLALDLEITGLFSQALTLHKRSQPSLLKAGLFPCGFLLSYFPAADFKGLDHLVADRVTPVVCFRLLKPYHAGNLYFPEKHREILERLFGKLAISRETIEAYDTGKPASVYSMQVNEASSYARMFVYETGRDIILSLKNYLYRLRSERLLIGELMLNLNDPLSALYYNEIEALGFVFTGILPATLKGNFMTMVYLNGINPDFDNIQLIDDYGQDLLDYIRKDYEGRF